MAKRDELLDLFDLADTKDYDLGKATMEGHVRLVDLLWRPVVNKNGGAAFSYSEARQFLEALPDLQ